MKTLLLLLSLHALALGGSSVSFPGWSFPQRDDLIIARPDTLRLPKSYFAQKDSLFYKPVCGSDGKTYANAEAARFAGLTDWTPGHCFTYGKVQSLDPQSCRIEQVTWNGMSFDTPDPSNGYGDFTNVVFELFADMPNLLTLEGNPTDADHILEWKVWIDFDKDGRFEDGEAILQDCGGARVQTTLPLPKLEHLPLFTRMRVLRGIVFHYDEPQTLEVGEVEDFTVMIVH